MTSELPLGNSSPLSKNSTHPHLHSSDSTMENPRAQPTASLQQSHLLLYQLKPAVFLLELSHCPFIKGKSRHTLFFLEQASLFFARWAGWGFSKFWNSGSFLLNISFFNSSFSYVLWWAVRRTQATPSTFCLKISTKFPISSVTSSIFHKTLEHSSAKFLPVYNRDCLSSCAQ